MKKTPYYLFLSFFVLFMPSIAGARTLLIMCIGHETIDQVSYSLEIHIPTPEREKAYLVQLERFDLWGTKFEFQIPVDSVQMVNKEIVEFMYQDSSNHNFRIAFQKNKNFSGALNIQFPETHPFARYDGHSNLECHSFRP